METALASSPDIRIFAVGDFSAQAVINTIITHAFPQDKIVGEEDAADMRQESGLALRNRIVELTNETLTAPLQPDEQEGWGLGPKHAQSSAQIMDVIDRGNYNGGRAGRASFPCRLCLSF